MRSAFGQTLIPYFHLPKYLGKYPLVTSFNFRPHNQRLCQLLETDSVIFFDIGPDDLFVDNILCLIPWYYCSVSHSVHITISSIEIDRN
jgi:hypothetical protein